MKAIKINKNDNVAVSIAPLKKGETITVDKQNIVLDEDVPLGHKFSLLNIEKGKDVVKYGNTIGMITADVKVGKWIHTHNLVTKLGEILNYQYDPISNSIKKIPSKSFLGYERHNGKIGIRNEIWIIPTVGCVNSIAIKLADIMNKYNNDGIDGFYAMTHPYGCSQMSEDQENTKKVLAGLIDHPNAGGVLVLGLGCENCNIQSIKSVLGKYDDKRVSFLECQKAEDEIESATEILKKLQRYAKKFKRTEIPASKLIVGLKCGGSDGLSGITANPLVGSYSDKLISMGGSAILTEVPEMFGAETLLFDRCENLTLYNKMVSLINSYKEYFKAHNQVIYENPSPGNKEGGITTLEEKSLGCVQKGGTSNITDVLGYTEKIKNKGLSVLSSPGNDLVSSTALAVSGAQIVLFTTGRGTPFGGAVPTVKISSNSALEENKCNWIDFNAGELLNGVSMNNMTENLFDFIMEIASGKLTKSEKNKYKDIAIFKTGVTL